MTEIILLLKKGLAGLLAFLTFAITIPVWIILIVGAWLYFDRSSAIRQAVNNQVKILVAGEELAANKEQIEGKDRLIAIQQKQAQDALARAESAEAARNDFINQLQKANEQNEGLYNELEEISKKPVDAKCLVTPDLFNRLRK